MGNIKLAILAGATLVASAFLGACSQTTQKESHLEFVNFLVLNPESTEKILSSLKSFQEKRQSELEQATLKTLQGELYTVNFNNYFGNMHSPQKMVIFTDHSCRFCQQAMNAVIASKKIRNGEILLVVREIPILNPDSYTSATLALSKSANVDYRLYHERISRLSPQDLKQFLSEEGQPTIDVAQKKSIDDEISKNKVLARKLGIAGTPAFIYNNRIYKGLHPEIIRILTSD